MYGVNLNDLENTNRSYRECPVLMELSTVISFEETVDGTISSIVGRYVGATNCGRVRRQVVYPEGLPDFSIMAVVGSSGSGKSTLLREMAAEQGFHFPCSKFKEGTAIVSNFKDRDEAVARLSAVGLKSIPTWVKPRDVLSVGEGFRADLALNVNDGVLFDEFTSTVDRNVARSCCTSFGKYIRRTGKKNIVVCSCHKDFVEYLKPDLVMDLDDLKVYDLRRAKFDNSIKIDIFKCQDKSLWKVFKEHHYMSSELNKACHFYVMRLRETGDLVGCFSTLSQMTGTKKWGWRVHRTVVLPDYQGLGISSRTLNFFGEWYQSQGRFLSIRTSSIPMLNSLKSNPMWEVGKATNSHDVDARKTHWTDAGLRLKGHIRDKDCTTATYLGANHGKPVVTLVVGHPEIQSGEYVDSIEKRVQTLVLDNDVVLSWGKVGSFTENERLHEIIGRYLLRHKFKTTLYGKEIKQDGEIILV
jgi:energy-coupling factor transporter ATP-binding protein EcfA2